MKKPSLVQVTPKQHCLFSWRAVCPVLFLTLGILKTTSSTGCSKPAFSTRVVGGHDSSLRKSPWMANLEYRGIYISSCGACVISTTWVITAAHCVVGKQYRNFKVVMGVLNRQDPTSSRVIAAVKNIIIHPKYRGDRSSGDLALVEMMTPVTFSEYIHPICLPDPFQQFSDGQMCTLTGWGNIGEDVTLPEPYTMQEVELPLIGSTACQDMFRRTFPEDYMLSPIYSDMICAGYTDGSKDACQGDSGSPLACTKDGNVYLVGIVSWGVGCATPGIPGVYTNIPSFSSWIAANTGLKNTQISTRAVNTTEEKVMMFTTSQSSKVVNATTADTVNTTDPNRATESFTTPRDLQNCTTASFQNDTTTDAGKKLSTPLSLLLVAFLLTEI